MDDQELLRSILSDVAIAASALEASPDTPVVHCPGWTVADLVGHHGGVRARIDLDDQRFRFSGLPAARDEFWHARFAP